MIVCYNEHYVIGIIVFAFLALIFLKLIWNIGIPLLKLVVIFLLILFGVKYLSKHVHTTSHQVKVDKSENNR